MKERIKTNEKRLDEALKSIEELYTAVETFKNKKQEIDKLNEYYGSKEWFKDKKDLEEKKITNIKAGVLSEDSVWNMNEDIKDLLEELEQLIALYK